MLFVISTNNPSARNNGTLWETSSGELLNQEAEELDKLVEKLNDQESESENEIQEEQIDSDIETSLEKKSDDSLNDTEKKGFFSFLNFWREKWSEDGKSNLKLAENTNSEWWNIENIEDSKEISVENQDVDVDPEVRTLVSSHNDTWTWKTNMSGTWTWATEEESESLFDRLFGEREIEELEEIDDSEGTEEKEEGTGEAESVETINDDTSVENEKWEKWDEDIEESNKENEQNIEKSDEWDEDITSAVTVSAVQNVGGNIIKGGSAKNNILHNASYAYMTQYPQHLIDNTHEVSYPGLHLETKVWKIFEVGVEMLKLNNVNFDVKLWLMHRWDSLKQITAETEHGCFMIEILHSKNKKNIGKKGYVCKKYLREATNMHMEHHKNRKAQTQKVHQVQPVQSKVHTPSESFLPEELMIDSSSESFLPVGSEIEASSESFLPEEPVIESFLPEEDMNNETMINSQNSNNFLAIPQEASSSGNSFLPEEPIMDSSSESFLPEEPVINSSSESFLPEE